MYKEGKGKKAKPRIPFYLKTGRQFLEEVFVFLCNYSISEEWEYQKFQL